MTRRSNRSPSTRGRRPRLIPAGVVDTSVFAERLRQSITDGEAYMDVATISSNGQIHRTCRCTPSARHALKMERPLILTPRG